MLTLTAAGSVSDYEDTSSLQQNVATAAGVDTSLVTIEVSAASVIITATIAVLASTTAAAVQASLSSTLGIAAESSAAPSTALGVTVLTVPTITIAVGGAPSSAPLWPPPPRRPRTLPLPPPPTPSLPSRPSFAPAAASPTLPAALDDPSADMATSEVIVGVTAGGICAIVALCGTAYFCFVLRLRGVFRLRGVRHQRLHLFTVGSCAPATVTQHPKRPVRAGSFGRISKRKTPPLRALKAHDSQHVDDPEKPAGHDDAPAQIADPDATKPEDWDDEADGEWAPPHVLQVEIRHDSIGDDYHAYNI